jgi:hypothetical protein
MIQKNISFAFLVISAAMVGAARINIQKFVLVFRIVSLAKIAASHTLWTTPATMALCKLLLHLT